MPLTLTFFTIEIKVIMIIKGYLFRNLRHKTAKVSQVNTLLVYKIHLYIYIISNLKKIIL